MDRAADWYHVTKVKTIGDAYLAIAGLPGDESENCNLDMLRFASCVAQVFSYCFDHPTDQTCALMCGIESGTGGEERAIGWPGRGCQRPKSQPRVSSTSYGASPKASQLNPGGPRRLRMVVLQSINQKKRKPQYA